jgi:hypothetical protein
MKKSHGAKTISLELWNGDLLILARSDEFGCSEFERKTSYD